MTPRVRSPPASPRRWTHPAGFAYGSLASGGDILWAEALLARGCEIHVVLPFALEEFIAASVADGGDGVGGAVRAVPRRRHGGELRRRGPFLGDDVLYGYCAELAMGLALLRARYLDADVHQLALWDGRPARASPERPWTSPPGAARATR